MTKTGKTVIKLALFSIILSVTCVILALMFYKYGETDQRETIGSSLPVVVIDAGHGGADGGASGADGTLEKDINLEMALTLGSMLKANGVRAVLTRDEDVMLDTAVGNSNKMRDLLSRVEIAGKYPDCIFVSLHANKFADGQYKGLQVFYSDTNEQNRVLANSLQDKVRTYLQPENERVAKDTKGSVFILDRIKTPSVLIECGFLSNEEDLRNLRDENYRKELCTVISSAVTDFLNIT